MLHNYLAAALRNLARNRLYAAINIIGLSVGFATALLIGLFVRHETTFDRFIPGYQNIYKVSMGLNLPENAQLPTEDVRGWIPEQIGLDVPEVARIARLAHVFSPVSLRHGDVEAIESRFYWADPNIFEVLPLPVYAGTLKGALDRPDGLVLTRRMARRYFGTDNPIGESLEIDRGRVMTVTAVLQDLPSNTHLNTEIFGSGKSMAGLGGPFAPSARVYAYLQLKPGATADELRASIARMIERNRPASAGSKPSALYIPAVRIDRIHLSPTGAFAMTPGGELRSIRAFAIVGVLVLLLATINFVNLKTARAARRAVEVGVRKACGARRRDLMVQFIGESLIYAALAMLIAMALVELLLLPWMNAFLDRAIVFEYWHASLLGCIAATVLVVGTLAGVYPALVLSAFRPANVLKGTGPTAVGSGRVRQSLVILQFAVLIGLMVSTAVIYRQTAFGLEQGLRFNKDRLVSIISVPSDACEKSSFRTAVDNLPGVVSAACSEPFLDSIGTAQYLAPDGREVTLHDSIVGAGTFELLGLKPVAGRFFAPDREADSLPPPKNRSPSALYRVVINEQAVKTLGFESPAAAIGKTFGFASGERREIIGVVPDFSRETIRESIEPMFYQNTAGWFSRLNVKLRAGQVPETLRAIDRLWERIPGQTRPIQRQFYDEYMQSLYSGLTRQRTIFTAFAMVALLLAGLGLFGLAGFTVERRTREIGIRKAMGAETGDVTRLLLWQFAKPVLWANVLAWPVAGYVMYRWLLGFTYRIDLEPWLFVSAALAALLIAMLTVGTHSILVARAKPVTALRYE
jgi:putative ABC transport system permease protein